MNKKSQHSLSIVAGIAAVALTLALFAVGGRPNAGQAFQGMYHWLAHLGIYWLIAVVYGFALPRLAWPLVGLIVAGIGATHEFYEITAHHHEMEYADAGINALGAFLGALARPSLSRQVTNRD
ncbi:MAG TPA: hypothetical protein PLI90_06980 [Rhodocyclaceae bacterium]|nr:hypothetical protein [Rhodocyclaceae bacterium]